MKMKSTLLIFSETFFTGWLPFCQMMQLLIAFLSTLLLEKPALLSFYPKPDFATRVVVRRK